MKQYERNDFARVVKLGNESSFRGNLFSKHLTIEINPSLDKPGKYYPGESLTGGSIAGKKTGMRNNLLEIKDLSGTFGEKNATPGLTLWHEFMHERVGSTRSNL